MCRWLFCQINPDIFTRNFTKCCMLGELSHIPKFDRKFHHIYISIEFGIWMCHVVNFQIVEIQQAKKNTLQYQQPLQVDLRCHCWRSLSHFIISLIKPGNLTVKCGYFAIENIGKFSDYRFKNRERHNKNNLYRWWQHNLDKAG